MRKTAQDLYRLISNAHASCHLMVQQVWESSKQSGDVIDVTDLAYAAREAWRLADDMRKELNRLQEEYERLACILWVHEGSGDSIRTGWCTATPTIKQNATLPKKSTEPENYAKFMGYLGIKPELYQDETVDEVVRPHWPGVSGLLTRLAEQGNPLPPGIDPNKVRTTWGLTIRGRKGITE